MSENLRDNTIKITVAAVSVSALQQLRRFEKSYQEKYGKSDLQFTYFYVAGASFPYALHREQIVETIRKADINLIDIMGVSEELQQIVQEGLVQAKGQILVLGNVLREYNRIGSFSMASMKMMGKKKPDNEEEKPDRKDKKSTKSALDKMHTMRRMALMMGNILPFGVTRDMKNLFLLMDYWQQASETDMDSFMHLLLRSYFGRKELPKPEPCTMRYGIYLEDPYDTRPVDTVEKYGKQHSWKDDRKTIAFLFYGHTYPNDFMPVVKAFYRRLNEQYNILPIAFSQNEDQDLPRLESYLCDPRHPVCAILNFMPFRLGAGPMGGDAEAAVHIIEKAGVPYLKPVALTKTTREQWKDAEAVNAGEFLISMMLPELDGGIHTSVVGTMREAEERDALGLALAELAADEERVNTYCNRLERLLALGEIPNEHKKIALVCYNYPAGEDNVFGGAFLDTFRSVERLLAALNEAGYGVEKMTAEQLREQFVASGLCNEPQWGEEKKSLLQSQWEGKSYEVHGICNGQIFIGLQPVRESGNVDNQGYHDRNRKPSGEYLAFYHWIREEFRADAIVHVGTHGTLEFLPGKENGMSRTCYPDQILGMIPHFYLYYMGNPSEAMIAKRRSMATLISYQAPPLKKSGLYGVYGELKETIAEYRESLQSAPERAQDLLEHVEKLAKDAGLLTEQKLTSGLLDPLEEMLYRYENSLITDGLHVLDETEIAGLLRALEGKYIEVGPGGDPVKNPKVLPGGRNLVQFDPRLIPTKTAYERGWQIGQQAVEKYREEHGGDYPESTALILWGLETSRSQGETLGQIMYYLGIELKTGQGSFDNRMQLIPMEKLKRPRIDVTIHICGFFRDMYPNLIANLNEMLHALLKLGENEKENYYYHHTVKYKDKLLTQGMQEKDAWELAGCRIFGPKQGEYGTSLTRMVHDGTWEREDQLGKTFLQELSYGYTYHQSGVEAEQLVEMNYRQVEFISQVRNNVEYELTDLDHYYEFYGGLAKAVETVGGKSTAMYVADTTGEKVRVEELRESLERGIHTRLLNPAWIEGMMRHEYHGVNQIMKRFENVMGFAASTQAVDSSVFSQLEQCYVENEELRKAMQKSNQFAYLKMMERLMEAKNRGYWDATKEQLDQVRNAYLETEGEVE